jgi:Secretion system C-terminal sorting domain
MKTFLLTIISLLFGFASNAQQILCQDFSNSTTGWVTSNGSSIAQYENFHNACAVEYGIITPGVGGNNPAKVLSQIITPNQTLIEVKFFIDRYNSNLSCASHSNFGCATTVDIYAVESTYNGTDPVGDGAVIYADYSTYLLPISGGQVSVFVTIPPTLPAFRVFFNFRTANNCNQGGTKYVMDKFCFTGYTPCQVVNTCPPIANNDLFISGAQGFANSTLLANVYGTNLAYTPSPSHSAYVTRSLTHPLITPSGGNDFDIDNHPLADMTFTLLSQTFISGTDATFTFNSDGTFSFTRLNPNKNQFFFTYRLTDPFNNFDDAIVRIDYSTGAPLPVKLTNFNASKINSHALLSWETAQEMGNKGFDILRNTNGSFEKIGFVASKAPNGNSSTKLTYSYKDMDMPLDKDVFYRLSQIDIDGKQFLSDIRVINNSTARQPVLIYPNPSKGDLRIVIPSTITGFDVNLYSATGSVIQSHKNVKDRQMDITGLQPGVYMVKILSQNDNAVYTKKIIVQ